MADDDEPVIDLTGDEIPQKVSRKRASPAAAPAGAAAAKKKKSASAASKTKAHALLWICSAGKGQGRAWKKKALRIVGVYKDKAAAEEKKRQIMERHTCCGHGDILVGGTWEDEIDLVVRPVEEMAL